MVPTQQPTIGRQRKIESLAREQKSLSFDRQAYPCGSAQLLRRWGSETDLHCGWCDSHGIEWGLDGYRKTIQWGINIIMYAMTH